MMSASGSQNFFFILGRERSGTTYLQSLLNGHKNICVPPESPFIKYLSDEFIDTQNWTDSTISKFADVLFEEPYFGRWKMDKEKLLQALHSVEEKTFANLCKEVIANYAAQHGKSDVHIIGDKNPVYSTYNLWLSRAFYPVRFICITRDYHAQIHSMRKMKLETQNVAALAYRWKFVTKELDAFAKFFPEITLFCTYEELRFDTENTLKKICEFLDISYDDQMIENRKKTLHAQPMHKQHHTSQSKDLSTTPDEEWKEHLSALDVKIAEWLCHDVGKPFGYKKTLNNLSFMGKVLAFPGLVFGFLYFPFLSFLDSLPYQLKRFIYQKIFMRFFAFWKRTRKEEKLNQSAQND